MFLITLRFSEGKARAAAFMQAHNAWLAGGFAQGTFLLSGSLRPNQGGAILAHGTSKEELQQFVNKDPFVVNDVVSAEILEIALSRVDDRLAFLKGSTGWPF